MSFGKTFSNTQNYLDGNKTKVKLKNINQKKNSSLITRDQKDFFHRDNKILYISITFPKLNLYGLLNNFYIHWFFFFFGLKVEHTRSFQNKSELNLIIETSVTKVSLLKDNPFLHTTPRKPPLHLLLLTFQWRIGLLSFFHLHKTFSAGCLGPR